MATPSARSGSTSSPAGDVVLVRAGGRVPADGTITDGAAEMDESMITGESKPVAKSAGDRVIGGTVSTDSSLRVRSTPSATTPPWPASNASSPTPRRAAAEPRRSPTASLPCSSTSPPPPPPSPSWSGR